MISTVTAECAVQRGRRHGRGFLATFQPRDAYAWVLAWSGLEDCRILFQKTPHTMSRWPTRNIASVTALVTPILFDSTTIQQKFWEVLLALARGEEAEDRVVGNTLLVCH